MTSHAHTFPIRVYYEDTDLAGIVYYANYLKFAERARTEALRVAGIEQSDLMREEGVGFVVRRCNVDFLKPARMDDLLTIETRLEDIGKVSIRMQQTIKNGDETLVEIDVKLAVVGRDMGLIPLPPRIRNAMKKLFKH
ncbi:MAG: tol-pal system-associated acyl-CoA thioesterase [Alphaproteobacteria bacterium]|nr:tol-pal system-associated acyl-CoA thioesterase [Alphaproteobacteria bacterium]